MFDFLLRYMPRPKEEKPSRIPTPQAQGENFDEFLISWISHTRTQLSPVKILNILECADEGQSQDQAALFQVIQEKEPIISAHLQTRKLAVLGADWSIQHEDEKKQDELTSILERAKLRKLIEHLTDAISTGYAGAAIDWLPGGSGIKRFVNVMPQNWVFDAGGYPAVVPATGQPKGISEYPPYQFAFHVQSMKPGIPSRGGLLRSLVWLYFFKSFGIKNYNRYLERFGIPFTVATINPKEFEHGGRVTAILSMLQNMGASGVAAIPDGSSVVMNNPTTGAGNDAYFQWFRYIDDVFALLILGQLATSGDAGGLSKGQAQENVRNDILEADCRNMMDTLTEQVVRPLERFKYGTEEAYLHMAFEPPADKKAQADVVSTLASAGFKAKREWVEETFDIPLEDAPTAVDKQDGKQTALSDDPDGDKRETFISKLTAAALDRVYRDSESMAAMTAPLQAEIRKVFADMDPDAEDILTQFKGRVQALFDAYPEVYDRMDPAKLEGDLQSAIITANIQGNNSQKKRVSLYDASQARNEKGEWTSMGFNAENALEISAKVVAEYGDADFGIRILPDDMSASVGDILEPSFRWEDGEITSDQLDGTSVLGIGTGEVSSRDLNTAIKQGKQYLGKKIAIIAGERLSYGEDVGEEVFKNAKVIAIFDNELRKK